MDNLALPTVVLGCRPDTLTVAGGELLVAAAFVPVKTAFTECEPKPKTMGIVAVPFAISCALPSSAFPWHSVAVAIQKLIVPGETGFPPAVTAARKVTAVGHTTEADESVRTVDVAC